MTGAKGKFIILAPKGRTITRREAEGNIFVPRDPCCTCTNFFRIVQKLESRRRCIIFLFICIAKGFWLLLLYHKLPLALCGLYCLEHTNGFSTSCSVLQKINGLVSQIWVGNLYRYGEGSRLKDYSR